MEKSHKEFIMKKTLIATAMLSTIFASTPVFAADYEDAGELTILGTVVDTPCQFVSGNSKEEIRLERIKISDVQGSDIGKKIEGTSAQTENLKIKCEGNNKNISIKIKAADLTAQNIVKNNNSAGGNNTGFYLEYNDKQITKNYNEIIVPTGAFDDKGEYQIPISAYYARSADGAVTAGDVSATVTLEVSSD